MSELIYAAKTMYDALVSDSLFLILILGTIVAVRLTVNRMSR